MICDCRNHRKQVSDKACDSYLPHRPREGNRVEYCSSCRHGFACHVARTLKGDKEKPSKQTVIRCHDFKWYEGD